MAQWGTGAACPVLAAEAVVVIALLMLDSLTRRHAGQSARHPRD